MGDFSAIVRVLGRVMGDQGHDVPMCDTVVAQLVGHETNWFLSLTLQEFSKESPRRTPVPTGLDEEVDQVTVLVHGAPEGIVKLRGGCQSRPMNSHVPSYHGYRFPREIISHAV